MSPINRLSILIFAIGACVLFGYVTVGDGVASIMSLSVERARRAVEDEDRARDLGFERVARRATLEAEVDDANHSLALLEIEQATDATRSTGSLVTWAKAFNMVAWQTVFAFAPVAAMLFIAGSCFILLASAWNRREPLVEVSRNGAMPIPRRALSDMTAQELIDANRLSLGEVMAGRVAIADASRPTVPMTLTTSHDYSPRITYRNHNEGRLIEPPPMQAPVTPTVEALVDEGRVGYGKPMTFAFRSDNGEPIVGTWPEALVSVAVAGQTGSGKTSTAVAWAAMFIACMGGRVAFIDPHIGSANRSLVRRLLPVLEAWPDALFSTVASTDVEIARLIDKVQVELDDRATTGRSGPPLLLVWDEFSRAGRRGGYVAEAGSNLLEAIAQEGGKFNVGAMPMGHIWTAVRSGGTEARSSIPSAVIHRIDTHQAACLVPRDEVRESPRFAIGEALLSLYDGSSHRVTVPFASPEAIAKTAKLLPPPKTFETAVVAPPAPESPILRNVGKREIQRENDSFEGENPPKLPSENVEVSRRAKQVSGDDPGPSALRLSPDLRGDLERLKTFRRETGETRIVQTIDALWGEKPGSGSGYKAARERLDKLVGILDMSD